MMNRIIWRDMANYESFSIDNTTNLINHERGGISSEDLEGLSATVEGNNWYVVRTGSGGRVLAAHNIDSCSSWYLAAHSRSIGLSHNNDYKGNFVSKAVHRVCDPPSWEGADFIEELIEQGFVGEEGMSSDSLKYKAILPLNDRYKANLPWESTLSPIKYVPPSYLEDLIEKKVEWKRKRKRIKCVYIVLQSRINFDQVKESRYQHYKDVPSGMFKSQWVDVHGFSPCREYYDVLDTFFEEKRGHSVDVHWWDHYIYNFLQRAGQSRRIVQEAYDNRDFLSLRLIKRKTTLGTTCENLRG